MTTAVENYAMVADVVHEGALYTVMVGASGIDSFAIAIEVSGKRFVTARWDGHVEFAWNSNADVAALVFYQALTKWLEPLRKFNETQKYFQQGWIEGAKGT
jgi:hypothetical protein